MVELRWAESAADDLEEICNYIASDSEEDAKNFARRIIDTIESLAAFPYSGRVVPEFNNQKLREIILPNYRIIYRINADKMEIVRIFHSARKFQELD